jgi:hypothetical protein
VGAALLVALLGGAVAVVGDAIACGGRSCGVAARAPRRGGERDREEEGHDEERHPGVHGHALAPGA